IIPAYRAADTIAKVVTGIPSWVTAIYVVDDASQDETAARLRAVRDPRIQLLVHDVNRGVGGGLVTGDERALHDGLDICGQMDADGQKEPQYLLPLIEPLVSGRAH